MANIFEYDGIRPVVGEGSFIHPTATLIGDVIIGREVFIGPGAVLRGDLGRITLGDGCNVQESCTIHMFPGVTVTLEEEAHIGHGAIIHGAQIGRDTLVGMNAVVMDGVTVGAECVIGAATFVPTGMTIPARKVVLGSPGKIVKDVSDEMLAWKNEGTQIYKELCAKYHNTMRPCEPLREVEAGRGEFDMDAYKIWQQTLKKSG